MTELCHLERNLRNPVFRTHRDSFRSTYTFFFVKRTKETTKHPSNVSLTKRGYIFLFQGHAFSLFRPGVQCIVRADSLCPSFLNLLHFVSLPRASSRRRTEVCQSKTSSYIAVRVTRLPSTGDRISRTKRYIVPRTVEFNDPRRNNEIGNDWTRWNAQRTNRSSTWNRTKSRFPSVLASIRT